MTLLPRSRVPAAGCFRDVARPASSARTMYLPRISDSRLTARAGGRRLQIGVVPGERDDLHAEALVVQIGDGEADAVDGNRSLPHDVAAPATPGSESPASTSPPAAESIRGRPGRVARGPGRNGRPSRAPALNDRSRLTFVPGVTVPIVVIRAVSGDTSMATPAPADRPTPPSGRRRSRPGCRRASGSPSSVVAIRSRKPAGRRRDLGDLCRPLQSTL